MSERESGIIESLQHPRRSLGNRYRSQAEKFLRISDDDHTNLSWAEQSARQSILHDFTNPDNWRVLIRIKIRIGDTEGVRAVLEDLITVLGRDSNHLSQLNGVDILGSAVSLLEGALKSDPLDPDEWWRIVGEDDSAIMEFSSRLKGLDVRDSRANILFSRRLERLRASGKEDLFLELSRYLLAQRPNNHEAWGELGRMYERRGEYDQAWLCYDQEQIHFPRSEARDGFKERMEGGLVGRGGGPWKSPGVSDRIEFLDRMRELSIPASEKYKDESATDSGDGAVDEIVGLRSSGRLPEAFFLARRLAAEGDEDAAEIVEEILEEMGDE
jgi:tetratricopeptide (TPR) repeat protein